MSTSDPSVRLAWFDIPAVNETLAAPSVGLAQNGPRMQHNGSDPESLELAGLGAPTVRLAQPGSQCDNSTKEGGWNGCGAPVAATAPALLVSYYYLEPFLEHKAAYRYRDWVMDSGAFSAHNSGVNIDLNAYIDKCLELLESDQSLTEVFSLDVIPKDQKPITVQHAAEQSLQNCEAMWAQGVPAIPTFHRGEDESFLYAMAAKYPKIAIGGVALLRGEQKRLFCEQVFARVWPKKIHGLGMSSEELVYNLPFHSVDATNWEIAPCAFGNWQKYGKMSVRGSNQDLRSQVAYYLELETKARVRWVKEMQQLEALPKSSATCGPKRDRAQSPTVRLAVASADGQRAKTAFQPPKETQTTQQNTKTGEMEDKWVDYWKNRMK